MESVNPVAPRPTYPADSLDWIPLGGTGWHRASVTLAEGESAWNPASTKRLVYGPAVVTYERGPSGAVDAIVEAN